jgi:hypothetical protein
MPDRAQSACNEMYEILRDIVQFPEFEETRKNFVDDCVKSIQFINLEG